MANGWTKERKAKQSIAITGWSPWKQSTGPRSAEGKARVSRNAYRGALRAEWRQLSKVLDVAFREQQWDLLLPAIDRLEQLMLQDDLNRTGFLGDLISWEDGVYGTVKSVFPGGARARRPDG